MKTLDRVRALYAHSREPVDGASVGVFRIAFGLLLAHRCWTDLRDGFVDDAWLAPGFRFAYAGFEWVQPWPGDGLHWHVAAVAFAALAVALGVAHRLAAAVFTVGFAYLFLLDETQYLNHDYLICLFGLLLVFVPADRALSVRAWRRPGEDRSVPRGALWLLRTQMGLVYLYAGIAKLNADWLSGWPMRQWLVERGDVPLIGPVLSLGATAVLMSWAGAAIDLAAWPLLSMRRTRPWMLVVLVAFHFLNAQIFSIGVFPWLSIAATTLFLEPSWPRRWLRLGSPGAARARPDGLGARGLFAAGALYLLVQIAVPLRHWLYPGNVSWTEEGHRFAWHMMLRHKEGETAFVVRDAATGAVWGVHPLELLTEEQDEEMSGRPHMIHRLAREIRRRAREDLDADVTVRVRSTVSLNGRAPQPLIDPRVDLGGRALVTFGHAAWILPLSSARSADQTAASGWRRSEVASSRSLRRSSPRRRR